MPIHLLVHRQKDHASTVCHSGYYDSVRCQHSVLGSCIFNFNDDVLHMSLTALTGAFAVYMLLFFLRLVIVLLSVMDIMSFYQYLVFAKFHLYIKKVYVCVVNICAEIVSQNQCFTEKHFIDNRFGRCALHAEFVQILLTAENTTRSISKILCK